MLVYVCARHNRLSSSDTIRIHLLFQLDSQICVCCGCCDTCLQQFINTLQPCSWEHKNMINFSSVLLTEIERDLTN